MTDAQPARRKRRRKRKRKAEKPSDVSVRRATVDDVPRVVEIIVAERADRVRRGAHRSGLGEIDSAHLADVFRGVAEGGGLMVAELGGKIVGHCAMTLAPTIYNAAHITALVFSVLVIPEARKAGCGSALLDMAEKCAEESGAAGLSVGVHWDGQEAARQLLTRGHRLSESYYFKGF